MIALEERMLRRVSAFELDPWQVSRIAQDVIGPRPLIQLHYPEVFPLLIASIAFRSFREQLELHGQIH